MIKKLLTIFLFFIFLVIILFSTTSFEQSIVVHQHNDTKQAIDIKNNLYKDRFCNMTIKDISYCAQAVLPNKDTLFFDDIGCLVLWLNTQDTKNDIVLWVYSKDKKIYIDAREAWYSLTEHTPMRYGFGAYKIKKESFIDFETMSERMLSKKTMANPKVRKELLGNN